jgi:hypothetical protein
VGIRTTGMECILDEVGWASPTVPKLIMER